jgi:ribose/xylose/arabinose/galactoside ABC-type transport system permease subunit
MEAVKMAGSVKPLSYVLMGFVAGICAAIFAQQLSVDQVRARPKEQNA